MARKRSVEQMAANGDAVEMDEEMYAAIDAAADSDEVQERAAIIEDLGGEDAETTAERDAILGELDEEATREFEEGVDEGFRQVAAMSGGGEEATAEVMAAIDSAANQAAPKPGRLCDDGCGDTTKGGRFLPGHDMKLKSSLLRQFDSGDAGAGAVLVANGWATDESLAERGAKTTLTDSERAERKRLRLEAKLDQARAEVAKLEAELAAL